MKKLFFALFVSALLAVNTVSVVAQGTKFEPLAPSTDTTPPPNPCSQVTTYCGCYKYVKVVKYGCFGKKHYKAVKVYTNAGSTTPDDSGTMAAPPENNVTGGTIKGQEK